MAGDRLRKELYLKRTLQFCVNRVEEMLGRENVSPSDGASRASQTPILHFKFYPDAFLAGLLQIDGGWATAGGAGAGADPHCGGVIVSVVVLGLSLGPAPISISTLVNEGEGVRFVCHKVFDAWPQRKVEGVKVTEVQLKDRDRVSRKPVPIGRHLRLECDAGQSLTGTSEEGTMSHSL